jgi:hypothetical protein
MIHHQAMTLVTKNLATVISPGASTLSSYRTVVVRWLNTKPTRKATDRKSRTRRSEVVLAALEVTLDQGPEADRAVIPAEVSEVTPAVVQEATRAGDPEATRAEVPEVIPAAVLEDTRVEVPEVIPAEDKMDITIKAFARRREEKAITFAISYF